MYVSVKHVQVSKMCIDRALLVAQTTLFVQYLLQPVPFYKNENAKTPLAVHSAEVSNTLHHRTLPSSIYHILLTTLAAQHMNQSYYQLL